MTNQNLEEFNLMCDEFEDKLRKHVSSKSRVNGIKNKIKWHLKNAGYIVSMLLLGAVCLTTILTLVSAIPVAITVLVLSFM